MGIQLSKSKLLNGFKMEKDYNDDYKVTLENDNVRILFTIASNITNIELKAFNIKEGSSYDILRCSLFVILQQLLHRDMVADFTIVKIPSPINPGIKTLTGENLNKFYIDMGFTQGSEDGSPINFTSTVGLLMKTLGGKCKMTGGGKYIKTKSKRCNSKKSRKRKSKKSRKRKSNKRRKTRRKRKIMNN